MEIGSLSLEEEEEEDRISSLPDSLIHHILSFLYTEEAVQTCVLARRWRYIWTSVSVLKFRDQFHYPESDDDDGEITTNGLIQFVDKVLSLRDNSDIQSFHLDCGYFKTKFDDQLYECIDRWIATAVSHNVEVLYLEAWPSDHFKIPPCLCTCKSLKKLVLDLTCRTIYDCEIILPHTMSLPQLKSLCLILCEMWFIDEVLTNGFFSSFPSLEFLDMDMGRLGLSNMNILMPLPNLRHVRFDYSDHENYTVVELNAPSLLSFSFDGYLPTNFSLTNLSSLVTVDIKIRIQRYDWVRGTFDICEEQKKIYVQRTMGLLRGIYNVKFLKLNHFFLKALGGAPVILETWHHEFYNLQRLEIQTCLSRDCLQSIFYLLKISPNVESFSVQLLQFNYNKPPLYPFCDEVKINPEDIGDYWDAGLSLPCMICHPKFVEIKGLDGCVNELKFLEILLKYSMVLEKVVLSSYSDNEDSQRKKRMMKFREMLLMFPRGSENLSGANLRKVTLDGVGLDIPQ